MALSLETIYSKTKHLYHLELLSGTAGLNRIMNWIYVAEDISTTDFLHGGELIITTGMNKNNTKNWLYDFIHKLILHNTCGVILNIGKYIYPEDITPEIRELCENNSYPLFTMPWQTHIYDITRDYCARIFHDTHAAAALSEAFLDLIRQTNQEHALSILQRNGYSANGTYCICCIHISHKNKENFSQTGVSFSPPKRLTDDADPVSFALYRLMQSLFPNGHLCRTQEGCMIFLPENEDEKHTASLKENMLKIFIQQVSDHFPQLHIHAGLSSAGIHPNNFSEGYFHACSALTMAYAKEEAFCSFDSLGFYRILLCVKNQDVLRSYCDEKIGNIERYDKKHGTNYLDTLYYYLLYNGSIQKVAKDMYCHRNTINYRIRTLKETLHIPVDNTNEHFELLAAFQIKKYLEYFLF